MIDPEPKILTREFVAFLRSEFQLDWRGIHGSPHWTRVRHNGLLLAQSNGAKVHVVELFAFLHDVRREHDGRDRLHGERSAELACELNGRFFALSPADLQLLETACREHSNGHTQAAVTVQTCWDADRLDLGRVGIRPAADRMCTEEARDPVVIRAAYERSLGGWE